MNTSEWIKEEPRGDAVRDGGLRELSFDELDCVAGGKKRVPSDQGRTSGWDIDFLNWVRSLF